MTALRIVGCLLLCGGLLLSCGNEVRDEPGLPSLGGGGPECQSTTCSGHGTCSSASGSIACTCEASFAGPRCERCASDLVGEDCQEDTGRIVIPPDEPAVDPCDADPCPEDAVCESSSGSAKCTCSVGGVEAECDACATGFHFDANGTCVADLCADGSPKRILFIGNSYTSVNNLPSLVRELAAAENCQVEVESSLVGGAWFANHVDNATTQAKIASGSWDFVVLQNQSQVPGWKPEDVLSASVPHAESLASSILSASPDAEIVYFVTWGRRAGDALNCGYYPLVCTFEGHTQALSEGYGQYVSATGGDLAPVGSAWKTVVDASNSPFPSDDLWAGDGSHPTLRGSYLAASVLFGRIFRASPVGNVFTAGLEPVDASFLQETAGAFANLCGDGAIDPNEECDDAGPTLTCDSKCAVSVCGDGQLNPLSSEQCDDSNLVDGDFCDSLCAWEPGDAYEPDDDAAMATSVVQSAAFITDHTLVGSDDVDYFSFDATAGSTYLLRTGGSTIWCGGPTQVDTVLTLFEPDGLTQAAINDDSNGLCSRIMFEATSSATYYVRVASFNAASYGNYHLQIARVDDDSYEPNDDAATAADVGPLPASLVGLVDLNDDWFTFPGAMGVSYTVSIVDSLCQSGDQSDLEVMVYRADGTTLLASDYEEATEQCASVDVVAVADETLLVRVAQTSTPRFLETYGLQITSP